MSPRSNGDRHQHCCSYFHSDRNYHCDIDLHAYGNRHPDLDGNRDFDCDSNLDSDRDRNDHCHRDCNDYGDRDRHRNGERYCYLDSDGDRNDHCHRDRNDYRDRDRHRNGERDGNLDSDRDYYRYRDYNAYGHQYAQRHADGRSVRERARTHTPSDYRPDFDRGHHRQPGPLDFHHDRGLAGPGHAGVLDRSTRVRFGPGAGVSLGDHHAPRVRVYRARDHRLSNRHLDRFSRLHPGFRYADDHFYLYGH